MIFHISRLSYYDLFMLDLLLSCYDICPKLSFPKLVRTLIIILEIIEIDMNSNYILPIISITLNYEI